jgi:bacillithiol system protein YtxJ
MTVLSIQNEEMYNDILKMSLSSPVLILKLSPICPTSSHIELLFDSFVIKAPPHWILATIDVVTKRPLSRQIAEELGVKHESPQYLYIEKQVVVAHESHFRIDFNALAEKMNG